MNKLYFEIQKKCGQRADHPQSVQPPSRYPCFVLNHNNDWNDFGYHTWFALFYFSSSGDKRLIGELKIIHTSEDNTYNVIPKSFKSLDENYCSLGITTAFYTRLRDAFDKDTCIEILKSLQDCSVNIEQYEAFKDLKVYRISLLRDLSSQKAFKDAKHIIDGRPQQESYSIDYTFHPEYNRESEARFRVKFDPTSKQNYRCACVIGENGVGKTTMLSDMIRCIITQNADRFKTEFPLFSCVMSICTTPFDSFSSLKDIDIKELKVPYYHFCANQDRTNTMRDIIDAVQTIKIRTLNNESLFSKYYLFLKVSIPEISSYNIVEKYEDDGTPKLNNEALEEFTRNISSGQLQLFLLASFIYSKINLDTLIVIDEPEVHLHPAAIELLFSLMMQLIDSFECFCVVATHSPLVVREIPGEYVYLMRRVENIPEIGKIGFETLGCGITELYNEVFGYNESRTYLSKTIKLLLKKGKSNKEIVNELAKGNELSMNTRFLVKRLSSNYAQH